MFFSKTIKCYFYGFILLWWEMEAEVKKCSKSDGRTHGEEPWGDGWGSRAMRWTFWLVISAVGVCVRVACIRHPLTHHISSPFNWAVTPQSSRPLASWATQDILSQFENIRQWKHNARPMLVQLWLLMSSFRNLLKQVRWPHLRQGSSHNQQSRTSA